jgi:hypothetical protein
MRLVNYKKQEIIGFLGIALLLALTLFVCICAVF